MFYNLIQFFIKFFLKQFYSDIKVKYQGEIPKGPVIVVSNHPNFLLDPLLVFSVFEKKLWFLAKSTLFKDKFTAYLLSLLHLIPIYRKEDNPKLMSRNEDTFREVVSQLYKGNSIVIFPEGVSKGERKLSKIKTGAARIALQAEVKTNFDLDLHVQPVGITYTDFDKFKSSVTIFFGKAIHTDSYQELYSQDSFKAARKLTTDIKNSLDEVTVEVENLEHQDLVEKIAKLYKSRDSKLDDHSRLDIIAKNVEILSNKYPRKRQLIEDKLNNYLSLAESYGVDSERKLNYQISLAYFLILFPILCIGLVAYYIPYRVTGYLVDLINPSRVVVGSYRLIIGIVAFNFWFLLIFLVSFVFLNNFITAICIYFIVALSAHFFNQYAYISYLYILNKLSFLKSSSIKSLEYIRDSLISELEKLRVE